MSFYPPKINERFIEPRAVGEIKESERMQERQASFVCGAVLQISAHIEKDKIIEARFKAAGCGYLMAAADVLCEKIGGIEVNNLTVDFNSNLQALAASIERELETFPAEKKHCLELAIETFKTLVRKSRSASREDWNGEDALICVCFGISEKTIIEIVKNNHLNTVAEVTAKCQAGGGCGSCQFLIADILDEIQMTN